MRPLGSVRLAAGRRVLVCGEQCRVELALELEAGTIAPMFEDGPELLDLATASRRWYFCAGCGADLRPPLPMPRHMIAPRHRPAAWPPPAGPLGRLVPKGHEPRPCRLASREWRPDRATCAGCAAPRSARPARCGLRRKP